MNEYSFNVHVAVSIALLHMTSLSIAGSVAALCAHRSSPCAVNTNIVDNIISASIYRASSDMHIPTLETNEDNAHDTTIVFNDDTNIKAASSRVPIITSSGIVSLNEATAQLATKCVTDKVLALQELVETLREAPLTSPIAV